MNRTLLTLSSTISAALLLCGCAAMVLPAATQGGVIAAQHRSPGNAVDDTVIHSKILHLYTQNDVNDLLPRVNIEVVEGRVLLTGRVRNPETVVEAVRLAWQVNGVKEVINEVQADDRTSVKDYAKDIWITGRLKSLLLVDKHVQSINYNIETINQTVYLMGIASDQGELSRVTNLASTIKGVRKVVSHVRMKDDPRRTQ